MKCEYEIEAQTVQFNLSAFTSILGEPFRKSQPFLYIVPPF
uniref:Uncharacterized protein n=1 Tax=Anguilla anguilla TaxID=7936 RepID=A0A0E9U7U1_ANGAN